MIKPGDVVNGFLVYETHPRHVLVKCGKCGKRLKATRKKLIDKEKPLVCMTCRQNEAKGSALAPGTRFGHWVALGEWFYCEYLDQRVELCRCDCGTERFVERRSLRSATGSRACGSDCTALALARRDAADPRDIDNVAKYCKVVGSDYGFEPKETTPTDADPGSPEKIAILRDRVEAGEELFHADDRFDYSGCMPGVVQPAIEKKN